MGPLISQRWCRLLMRGLHRFGYWQLNPFHRPLLIFNATRHRVRFASCKTIYMNQKQRCSRWIRRFVGMAVVPERSTVGNCSSIYRRVFHQALRLLGRFGSGFHLTLLRNLFTFSNQFSKMVFPIFRLRECRRQVSKPSFFGVFESFYRFFQ